MILYKYRGNSDFTNKIFTEQKIWLSNANGLNDPFECSLQEIAKDWIEEKVMIGKQAQLAGFISEILKSIKNKVPFFGLGTREVKNLFSNLKAEFKFENQYQLYREFIKMKTSHYPTDIATTFSDFDEQLNQVGIFSLSETAENQLMWAHYADESKGIAIGFAVGSNTKLADGNYCLKVNYSDVLPSMIGDGFCLKTEFYLDTFGHPYAKQKISFNDPTFKLAITTKPTCWEYEKEWRYVEERSGSYRLPGQIKEIVFGLRCTSENREKYKVLAQKYITNPVDFFEIRKIPNTNSIMKFKI